MSESSPESPSKAYQKRNPFWKLTKIIVLSALALIFLCAATPFVYRSYFTAHFFEGYDAGLPLEVKVLEKTDVAEGHAAEWLFFQHLPDEQALMAFHYPSDATGPVPCVVLMLWVGAQIEYLEEMAEMYVSRGFAVACPEGFGFRKTKFRKKEKSFLNENKKMMTVGQSAFMQARRAVDFLMTRPEVDPERLYYAGASIGGMIGPAVLVNEPRYRAGLIMMSGANPPLIFDTYTRLNEMNALESNIIMFAISCLEPIYPENWLDQLDSRPILFQNTRKDETIPSECVAALHEGTSGPKEVYWYDTPHRVRLKYNREMFDQIIGDHLSWLEQANDSVAMVDPEGPRL